MKFFERFDDLARRSGDRSQYTFGVQKDACAQALREFADAIDRGEVALQSVRELSLASIEDYSLTTLRIVFADAKPIGTA